MMLLHWLAGDRETALAQYHACRELLQNELGLEPMQETRSLYETILRSPASPHNLSLHHAGDSGSSAGLQAGPPLKEMLQKLHYLKMIVEQTNTELQLLEGMIHRGLSGK